MNNFKYLFRFKDYSRRLNKNYAEYVVFPICKWYSKTYSP